MSLTTDQPAPTLEDRVTALEAALPHLQPFAPVDWTPEKAAEAEDDLRQKLGDGKWGHAVRLLPPAPVLTPETARALVRECVTIVQPGEVLLVRVPDTWTGQQAHEAQRRIREVLASMEANVAVLLLPGEEFAVARQEGQVAG